MPYVRPRLAAGEYISPVPAEEPLDSPEMSNEELELLRLLLEKGHEREGRVEEPMYPLRKGSARYLASAERQTQSASVRRSETAPCYSAA